VDEDVNEKSVRGVFLLHQGTDTHRGRGFSALREHLHFLDLGVKNNIS